MLSEGQGHSEATLAGVQGSGLNPPLFPQIESFFAHTFQQASEFNCCSD